MTPFMEAFHHPKYLLPLLALLLMVCTYNAHIDYKQQNHVENKVNELMIITQFGEQKLIGLSHHAKDNYDALNKTIREKRRKIASLLDIAQSKSYSDNQEILLLSKQLSRDFEHKTTLIEQQKRTISTRSLAENYYPKLSFLTVQTLKNNENYPLVVKRVKNLSSLLAQSQINLEAAAPRLQQAISMLSESTETIFEQGIEEDISRLVSYAKQINKANQTIAKNLHNILSHREVTTQEQLKKLYMQEHLAQQSTAHIYQSLVLIIAILILLYLYRQYRQSIANRDQQKELNRSLGFQKFSLDQHVIVSTTDLQGNITYANNKFCEISQYSRQELIGHKHSVIRSDFHDKDFFRDIWQTITQGHVWQGVICNRAKDGSLYWVESTLLAELGDNGKPLQYIGIRTDITKSILAEQEIQSLARFPEENPQPVLRISNTGECLYYNAAAKDLLSLWSEQEPGHLADDWKTLCVRLLETDTEETHVTSDSQHEYELSFIPIKQFNYINMYGRDITEVHTANKKLEYFANHDALTGLLNRYQFESRLADLASQTALWSKHSQLLYIDLDQFKMINDSSGHQAGDELLRQVSSLLTNISKKIASKALVFRIGGDEFCILIPDSQNETATTLGESILEELSDFRFLWDKLSYPVKASIGVTEINAENANTTDIIANADIACYNAKHSDSEKLQRFNPDDNKTAQYRSELRWATRIPDAASNDQLRLYAQPIISLKDETQHMHFEILIRMIDNSGTVLSPNVFLPAAERYGLMGIIDLWVFDATIKYINQYQLHNGHRFPHQLSVNLSGQSLTNHKLRDHIHQTILDYKITPGSICFEVTETAAIGNLSSAIDFIEHLKLVGCRFSLDDFGTGLSSFEYLKTLPIDYLKIDGIFVKDIVNDPLDAVMITSINQIAKTLGIKTIAEYVENAAISAKLRDIGIDYGQGYGIAKPMPINDVLHYISSQQDAQNSSNIS